VRAPVKLAAFAGFLALVLAGAAFAGDAIDPDRDTGSAEHAEKAAEHGGGAAAKHPVRGLAIAENGLRLVVEQSELRRGRTEPLRFRIVNTRGETVRDFEVEHEKRMHLIVVRRDMTGFQHLHPEQAADGSWTADVRLDDGGSFRMFADFARGGERYTLAADLRVDGAADLAALPAPAPAATSDGGYQVRLDGGDVEAGRPAELRFSIARDGRPVDVEPYLGAGGHLVALREGDLAFLHVHPDESERTVGFEATFPTTGRYRLFLQFQHQGRVQTVAFTREVR
jgi:hypothetical protein